MVGKGNKPIYHKPQGMKSVCICIYVYVHTRVCVCIYNIYIYYTRKCILQGLACNTQSMCLIQKQGVPSTCPALCTIVSLVHSSK